jgi:hypothetical protein
MSTLQEYYIGDTVLCERPYSSDFAVLCVVEDAKPYSILPSSTEGWYYSVRGIEKDLERSFVSTVDSTYIWGLKDAT